MGLVHSVVATAIKSFRFSNSFVCFVAVVVVVLVFLVLSSENLFSVS